MERMSTLDAGFFFVEHENVPMHIGSLAVFEGPAPAYDDLLRLLAAKLPLVPRYRQVVRTPPLQIFRPAWADDEHFEISYHVRHAAVPRRADPTSCARWPRGSSPSVWTGPGRFGRRGSSKGSTAAAGRPLEGASLHGGRSRWHGSDDGDVRPRARCAPPATPAPWEPQPGPSLISLLASGVRHVQARSGNWRACPPSSFSGWALHELLGFSLGLTTSARRLTAPLGEFPERPYRPASAVGVDDRQPERGKGDPPRAGRHGQ